MNQYCGILVSRGLLDTSSRVEWPSLELPYGQLDNFKLGKVELPINEGHSVDKDWHVPVLGEGQF